MAKDQSSKQAQTAGPAGADGSGRDPDQERRWMIAQQRRLMKQRADADDARAEKLDRAETPEDAGPAIEADGSRKNGTVTKSTRETTYAGAGDYVTTDEASSGSTGRNTNQSGSSEKTTTVDSVDGLSTSKGEGYSWKNTPTEQGGEAHLTNSAEDGQGKQTNRVGVSGKRDANGVSAGAEGSRTHQVGNAVTSNQAGAGGSYNNGQVTGDASVAHTEGNQREATTVGATAHMGENGPSGNLSAGHQEKDKQGRETGSSKVAIGGAKSGANASVETSDTTRDDDGSVHKDSTSLHGAVGPGGVTAGYDGTRTDTDKDGAGTTSSRGASFDTKAGTVSGHLSESKTNARGEQTSSDSVGGTIGKNGASVSASHSSGGTSVSAAGGFKVTADSAEFDPAIQKWEVPWRMELDGSVSAKRGNKSGPSASASAFTERKGVEVFDSKEEAEAFRKEAAERMMGGEGQVPEDAEGVLEGMKVGEQRGTASGVDLSAGATAQIDVVKLGVGAEDGTQHGMMVKRVSQSVVEVTTDESEHVKESASAGAGGISVGGHTQKAQGTLQTVRFDLSTEQGKLAFDTYQKTRQLLPGAQEVAKVDSQEEGSGSDVSAFGQQVSKSSTTSEQHGYDEKGKFDDYKGKQSFHGRISVPGVMNYRADESSQIHEREQGGEKSYQVTTSIDDSGGQASAEALGESTGDNLYDPSAKSSGHWTLTSDFTADDIKEIAEKAQSGALVSGESGLGGDFAELQKGLAGAGDDVQKQMKVISRYVADCGPQALADLRENVSRFHAGSEQQFDLKLDGDPNFTGPSFRRDLDAKIAGYQESLKDGGNASSVLNGVDGERSELERRLGEISNPGKYTDLPQQLREAEIVRTQNYLSVLDGIRSTAVAALEKPDASHSAQKGDDPMAARIQEATQNLAENKAECTRIFDKARTIRYYLRGAYAHPIPFSSIASARDWIHERGDPHDHQLWGVAEESFAGAMEYRAEAEYYQGSAETLQREYLNALGAGPEAATAAANEYACKLEQVGQKFSSAADAFTRAAGIYGVLLDKHGEWRNNLMMAYDEGTIAPPGAGTTDD